MKKIYSFWIFTLIGGLILLNWTNQESNRKISSDEISSDVIYEEPGFNSEVKPLKIPQKIIENSSAQLHPIKNGRTLASENSSELNSQLAKNFHNSGDVHFEILFHGHQFQNVKFNGKLRETIASKVTIRKANGEESNFEALFDAKTKSLLQSFNHDHHEHRREKILRVPATIMND